LLANAVRVPTCEPVLGLAFIALGPGVGTILAGLWAVLVSAVITRGRTALAVSIAIPVGLAVVSVLELYVTPAVFLFGEFAGYFPGPLYDTQVAIGPAYWTFRARSAATAIGI